MKDIEIEKLALECAPDNSEHNAYPNYSDTDIFINGFVEGFKKFKELLLINNPNISLNDKFKIIRND